MASDYVVSFRLPCDDFFVRHETNVFARNAKDAMDKIVKYIPDAECVKAEKGIVMLYGRKWNTIKTDVKRIHQIKGVKYGK